jgi:nucleoside phosphorylase
MSNNRKRTSSPNILFVAAVEFELRPFARYLRVGGTPTNKLAHGSGENGSAALLAAGMGRRGDKTFSDAIHDLQPEAVINVGIAGALDKKHAAGSTWAVQEWRDPLHPHTTTAHSDTALLEKVLRTLKEASIPCKRAIAVTVDEPLYDVTIRDRIRSGSGAHLVEMEGSVWAKIAAENGVPFASVRVISDHADRPLPGPTSRAARRAWMAQDSTTTRKSRLSLALIASAAWLKPRKQLRELKEAGDGFSKAVDALDNVAHALLPWPKSVDAAQ